MVSGAALMDFATIQPILRRDTGEQAFIEYLLNTVSGVVESYCGRKLAQRRETIILDNVSRVSPDFNASQDWYSTPEHPVSALMGLWVDPDSVFGDDTAVSSGILVDGKPGLIVLQNQTIPRGYQVVKQDYIYGYVPQRAQTAEVFTIDFSNAPATGKSFLCSTIGADGSEHRWQVWFKIAGAGAAPSPAAGYTLAEVDITGWDDVHLAPYLSAALAGEATVSLEGSIATITNVNAGGVTAPMDVDTGSAIAVVTAGTPTALSQAGALWSIPPEPLPMELGEAVVETVLWYAGRIQSRNVGERFANRDGLNITFEITLPQQVQLLLAPFRRLV